MERPRDVSDRDWEKFLSDVGRYYFVSGKLFDHLQDLQPLPSGWKSGNAAENKDHILLTQLRAAARAA